ncbi:hypothetical protein SIL85_22595 [Shewanella oneidensis]|uniref:Uncharacterized protein n=1 Tax=Shewanella oneidensis (strain ATCC 700550 / JCM 31522 / CIP 106686 / LMG 19005 / NCIMB 14063 / MR-1) TaxID=211586 RepID=Q8E861_SHEON|nr:hypothetical protein [Shewanella oneidensis]AAN53002.1 hypothetical protein SO_A0067 [Shewanella oneidensis MR-1]MDX5999753.1 hypothetical protein [Shewanella oneidensis]MEE2030360.1 hypothetical protein [Shewanella oneidensis]
MKSYPKKDRDQALSVLQKLAENDEQLTQPQAVKLALLDQYLIKNRELVASEFIDRFRYIEYELTELAIIQRVAFDNFAEFTNCLTLAGRFGCLVRLVRGGYFSGTDSLHIWPLLAALAINDSPTIAAYKKQFVPPFVTGHKVTVLACNAVYAILGVTPVTDNLREKLTSLKDSKYSMAMLRSLAAIINQDMDSFIDNISIMVKSNRSQQEYSPLEKCYCVNAHGLVNLWRFHTTNAPLRQLDLPLPWQNELNAFFTSGHESIPITFDPLGECDLSNLPIDQNTLVLIHSLTT